MNELKNICYIFLEIIFKIILITIVLFIVNFFLTTLYEALKFILINNIEIKF